MKKCSECEYMYYESPCSDNPYPEFMCLKDKWDGVERVDDLEREIDCEEYMETIAL